MFDKGCSLLIFLLACIPPTNLDAENSKTYGDFTNVKYVRNYDGDTITFNIADVPEIIGSFMPIRLYGVDTPEIKGKCAKEKALAKKAKDLVEKELRNAKYIILKDTRRGKYFRIVASIETENGSLSQKLLDKGLAVEYYGDTKIKDWCEE